MKLVLLTQLLLISVVLTACGQPGPLYLPPAEGAAALAKPDAKGKTAKELPPPDEESEPQSEPQTDLYYPF